MQLTTAGIVLRDVKIDENRLLTLLTAGAGVLSAWANGANRTRSRLAASTELLCYSDLVLFHSRGRYTVDKADSRRIFFGIRSDLDKLALASYLAELTMELAPHGEEADTYLKLLLNTLHYLEAGERPTLQLKALYELRILTLAGYMPALVACRGCASYQAEEMYFFPAEGEICCGCCLAGAAGGARVGMGVLTAMRHIIYSEPEKLFAFSLSDKGLRLLSRVAEDYLKCRLEKTLPTLEFWHAMQGLDESIGPIHSIQEDPF